MQKMISKMARMYPLMILMGFMIVVIAFVVGYFNSQTAAAYFAETKLVRETTLMAERASIESIDLWLPYFKFLGIGLLLGGIVMALRVIIENLQGAGAEVMGNLPPEARPTVPSPPWYARLMPIVMMMGELVFLAAFGVGLSLAATARSLFANALPAIDAAGAGTTLLAQLQGIKATAAWLVPFKFFGIATEFLAIAMGLATVIFILEAQTEMIKQGIQAGRARMNKASKSKDSRERIPA